MIDDPIVHMPKRTRYVASTILLLGAVSFLAFAYYLSIYSEESDVVLIVMSLVQMLLTGFALLIIFGFSQRSLSFDALSQKASEYLAKEIPDKIRDIHFKKPVPVMYGSSPKVAGAVVKVGHYQGDYRADYWVYADSLNSALLVDVNLNVRQALLVIKIPLHQGRKGDLEALMNKWVIPAPFSFVQDMPKKEVEYDQYLGSAAVHVYLYADFDEKFLVTPSERLMCAQAISVIIRDFFVLSRDFGYSLDCKLNEPTE
ncbi:MAG: hypothetical protein ABJE79_03615 [Marinomonas sp.]